MTTYELASLYSDYSLTLFALFTIYYSVTFAFIIASYFVARELSRPMAGLAISLFVVTMALAVIQQGLLVFSGIALGKKLGALAANPQTDLEWHALTYTPTFVLDTMPWAFNAANVIIYFGAIYFFFACRRGRFGQRPGDGMT